MATDFSDERISAYLDGELPADELAAVEALLADSAEQRQVLQDLQAIRGELQLLPQLRLGDDFAERVVAAAIEAKAAAEAASLVTAGSVVRKRKFWNSPLVAVPALAAAALVAVMIANSSWNSSSHISPGPVNPDLISTIPTPPGTPLGTPVAQPSAIEKALAELRQAIPGSDEALVVRLRVPKAALTDRGMDAALAKVGISRGRADQAMLANHVGDLYRQQVAAPSATPHAAVVAASEAVFIEAPFKQLEAALIELNVRAASQLDLRLEMVVAAKLPRSATTEKAEGEGAAKGAAPIGPVAHRLNPSLFPLPAEPLTNAGATPAVLPAVSIDAGKTVRVLILIEAAE